MTPWEFTGTKLSLFHKCVQLWAGLHINNPALPLLHSGISMEVIGNIRNKLSISGLNIIIISINLLMDTSQGRQNISTCICHLLYIILNVFSLTKWKDKFIIKWMLLKLLCFLPIFLWHIFSLLCLGHFPQLQNSALTCSCSLLSSFPPVLMLFLVVLCVLSVSHGIV